jgi:hypothetical protein
MNDNLELQETDLPPHNVEAERAVIGAVFVDPELFDSLDLKAHDFFIHRHRWIWQAFTALHKRGDAIDFVTVPGELEKTSKLTELGGAPYLTALINDCPSSLNAETYARTVKDMSARRLILKEAGEQVQRAYNLKIPVLEESRFNRFNLRNSAFALEPQPPIDYIVDGLITNSSVNVFYGEPGSKKTYATLSLAVCVANGKNWLDFQTKKTPVLYVDEESGERRFSRRLGEAIRGELCDFSSSIHYVCLAGFKLSDLNDPVLIQALIEETGARLIIFDALADLMDGDENDKKDVQPVFNTLRKIAERTDSAILIIHHSNKQGGYRGSSAIKGSVDLMVQVSSENGSELINFQSEKNRDGDQARWAAEAIWTESEFYLKASDRRPNERREREKYVIRYLTEHGPSYIFDLIAAPDTCTPGGARQGLYALAKQGKVRRTNPGDRKAMYELTIPSPVMSYEPVTLPLP